MGFIEGVSLGLCLPILFPAFYAKLRGKIVGLFSHVNKDDPK